MKNKKEFLSVISAEDPGRTGPAAPPPAHW